MKFKYHQNKIKNRKKKIIKQPLPKLLLTKHLFIILKLHLSSWLNKFFFIYNMFPIMVFEFNLMW